MKKKSKRIAIIDVFPEGDCFIASIEPQLECDYFYTPNYNSKKDARKAAKRICKKLKLKVVDKLPEESPDEQ